MPALSTQAQGSPERANIHQHDIREQHVQAMMGFLGLLESGNKHNLIKEILGCLADPLQDCHARE